MAHAVPRSRGPARGSGCPAVLQQAPAPCATITVTEECRKRHPKDWTPFCKGRATKPALGSLAPTQHPRVTSHWPLTIGNCSSWYKNCSEEKLRVCRVMVCCLLRVWGSFLNYLGKAEASLDSSSPTSSAGQLCHPLRAVQEDLIKHGLENIELKYYSWTMNVIYHFIWSTTSLTSPPQHCWDAKTKQMLSKYCSTYFLLFLTCPNA